MTHAELVDRQGKLRVRGVAGLAWASFCYWWPAHLAVGMGVTVAVGVLTGACILGDSLRASLVDLALQRLAGVAFVVQADRFFPTSVVDRLEHTPGFDAHFRIAAPVAILTAALRCQTQDGQNQASVGQVQVIACDARFWALGEGKFLRQLSPEQIIFTEALAHKIASISGGRVPAPGDRVILRLVRPASIPTESLFGDKRRAFVTLSFSLVDILPPKGLGEFSLNFQQVSPMGVFISLEALKWLDQAGKCNAVLLAERPGRSLSQCLAWLNQHVTVEPEAAGVIVEETPRGYLLVSYDGYVFPSHLEAKILRKLAGLPVQPVLTYLANQIISGDRFVPYSLVTGVDPVADTPLGPLLTVEGTPLKEIPLDTIVLNDWAAEDLRVRPGDTVRIRFFLPEASGPSLHETELELPVSEVIQLAEAANDPLWTPQIPGVTEKATIRDWEAPFEPFHPEWVRLTDFPGPGNDEDYWQRYGTTPKAFVSLATARKLWAGRFGQTTGFRMAPAGDLTLENLRNLLRFRLSEVDFVVKSVREEAFKAARGVSPFASLFVAFSSFVIAAGILLAVLFLSLTMAQRSREIGILLAVGFPASRIRKIYLIELWLTLLMATAAGLMLGWAYCLVLVAGLHSWWLPILGRPLIRPVTRPDTIVAVGLIGFLATAVPLCGSLARFAKQEPAKLLAGFTPENWPRSLHRTTTRVASVLGLGAAVGGLGLLLWGNIGDPSAGDRALWFFLAAVGFLIGGFSFLMVLFRVRRRRLASFAKCPTLAFATLNLRRNPSRTVATCVIFALAVFLVVAVSAFRLSPWQFIPGEHPGSGGFAFVVETSVPVLEDLSDQGVLSNWLKNHGSLGIIEPEMFAEGDVLVPFRMRPGEDASCLNLYQVRELTVLGTPERFIARGGFRVRSWVPCSEQEFQNPWLLLQRELPTGEDNLPLIPAFVDQTTATYALKLNKGKNDVLTVTDAAGRPARLKVVGVLMESIFQGQVLVHEKNFLQLFPATPGYRFFLVKCSRGPEESPDVYWRRLIQIQKLLEETFADHGALVETTTERLTRFARVQNTYLAIFQSLGSIGLLLGTLGLAAVQMRNVLERRRELSLLRALGFPRRKLLSLLFAESTMLALVGTGCGLIPAIVAVLPDLLYGQASWPGRWLLVVLGATAVAGIVASLGAAAVLIRIPMLRELRRE